MKFSAVIAFCVLGLASAQAPGKGGAPPKGGGSGGAGGFKIPEQLKGPLCAAKCIQQPLQGSKCDFSALMPKGGASGMAPPGGAPKPPMNKRQAPTGTAPGAGGAPPKFSLSPEQSAAISSARACVCSATPAFKAAADSCIPSSCATATGAAEAYVKAVNGLCKGVAGYVAMTPPPGSAAAATPAPKGP